MVCGGLPGGVLGWFEFVVGCCAAAKSIGSSAAKEAYRRVLAASWKRLRIQTLKSRKHVHHETEKKPTRQMHGETWLLGLVFVFVF